MHEASLAEGLLKLVLQTVEAHNAQNPGKRITRVTGINCEAGLISGFEPRALEDCFEIFAEGGMCEGARLDARVKPLACVCRSCGGTFELGKRAFMCPMCGSAELDFRGGHGLDLLSLDVECEDEDG